MSSPAHTSSSDTEDNLNISVDVPSPVSENAIEVSEEDIGSSSNGNVTSSPSDETAAEVLKEYEDETNTSHQHTVQFSDIDTTAYTSFYDELSAEDAENETLEEDFALCSAKGKDQCAEIQSDTEDDDIFFDIDADTDENLGLSDEFYKSESTSESESDEECTDSAETSDSPEEPLYADAPLSLNDCLIAVLLFSIRHSLTAKCLGDLLKLISLICRPLHCKMKATCYHFWKYFSNLKFPIKYHYFCSQCHRILKDAKSICTSNHRKKKSVSYFIELPLAEQVKALFERKSFVESLSHRFSRVKSEPNNVEDIYDGQIYKEQVESGFLSSKNPFNFSMLINFDGCPVYRSSGTSLWPVYFVINELPIHERFLKENMLLGGLWYGSKPAANLIMDAFRDTLVNLYKGVEVKLNGMLKPVLVRGKLLCATCDLPAKCLFMGMIQFNGKYGCHVCKQKGESVSIPLPPKKRKRNKETVKQRTSSVWVYKYYEDMPLRNHTETLKFGEEAQRQRNENPGSEKINVFGVTQPSSLSKLMPDFIRGMAIDIMHCLFLGVVKKLATLWFSPKYSGEVFSLYKYIDLIDKKFLKICPPNFVQRNVRSIKDHMHHWKASEWRNFFFYYSLPLLDGVLPAEYLSHYYDLVISMYELHGSSISPTQILCAADKLKHFVKNFQTLYGERHMTINIHLLLHIPLVVNNLGPLWAYSCAPFENLNGLLLQVITGTKHVQTQLANCAQVVIRLPRQLEHITSPEVRKYCFQLLHPSYKLKFLEKISYNVFSVGTYKLDLNPSPVVKNALKCAGFLTNRIQTFSRLKKGRFLFVSEMYTRSKKTVSSFASFLIEGVKKYGSILSFVRISGCSCTTLCRCEPVWFLAIVEVKQVSSWQRGSVDSNFSFIHKIDQTTKEDVIALNVNRLEAMPFFVTIGFNYYLCDPVNMLEAEL